MSAKLSSKNFYGGNLMVKCFVALVIFFCSVGNLFAQTETKVTINVDKVLIRTALERLQKETKVHFVYDEENIDQDKRVSLSPDSFVGRLSCIFQGSTDTTFYILAVYFGSVGIVRTRHAVPCGLLADAAGVIAAILICYLFFG